jgi:hypothetical protein
MRANPGAFLFVRRARSAAAVSPHVLEALCAASPLVVVQAELLALAETCMDEADVLARPSFAEVLASLERMVLAQKSLDAGGPHVEEVT